MMNETINIHSKESFLAYWNNLYPQTPPINYFFKKRLKNRWLRIHSLPLSKRYAVTEAEWAVLLQRQNEAIADLVKEGAIIKVVINYIKPDNPLFKTFDCTNIGVFTDEEGETVFQSFIFEAIWKRNCLDAMLVMVAEDEVRAFIIGGDCLIAPYDGGMDLILKDEAERNRCMIKYNNWLSLREDGL
jgi:hypothetical protein